jgi:phosphomannomutase/phosphoglucomutase
MEALSNSVDFPDSEINTIDGVRVDYENCWGLVRASNTTPCLVLRFEGNDQEALKSIKSQFKDWLEKNNISTKSL